MAASTKNKTRTKRKRKPIKKKPTRRVVRGKTQKNNKGIKSKKTQKTKKTKKTKKTTQPTAGIVKTKNAHLYDVMEIVLVVYALVFVFIYFILPEIITTPANQVQINNEYNWIDSAKEVTRAIYNEDDPYMILAWISLVIGVLADIVGDVIPSLMTTRIIMTLALLMTLPAYISSSSMVTAIPFLILITIYTVQFAFRSSRALMAGATIDDIVRFGPLASSLWYENRRLWIEENEGLVYAKYETERGVISEHLQEKMRPEKQQRELGSLDSIQEEDNEENY